MYPTPIVHELNLLFERPSGSPASSTSTLAEDDSLQPVPKVEQDLNPYAAPFIPKSSSPPRRNSIAKPAPPRPQPIWLDAFTPGTRTSATEVHRHYATAIVTSRESWPIEAMAELAQNFRWRGGEKITEESAGIAPFAFMVYSQFCDVFGEELSQSFLWHLRECVIGAFIVTWDPDSSTGISYRNAPSFNYVGSAIAQATFIGQLFKLELIPGPHTATCIVTILKGLNSYEHLEALRAIISSAGPTFWHGAVPGHGNTAIHRFVATFLEAVAPLRANMSVLGRFLKTTETRDIIVEIEQLCSGWVV
ncbi:hypothetical protein C8F01DRAFT_1124297 [Mycena amicta]|nr:hypothetical protein C8F01DRAFT_1124297 [Mycena amicta]